jgi:uncharacterized protein (TIGR00297 family)
MEADLSFPGRRRILYGIVRARHAGDTGLLEGASIRQMVLFREEARKIVHIAFGLVALSLRWLSTIEAALVALCALAFNRFIFRRVGGMFISRSELGYDRGIVLYPLAVLVIILLFPGRPELAAVCWIILAFGDGVATLVGRSFPLAPLPWNPRKSVSGLVSFIAAALPAAWLVYHFVTEVGALRWPLLLIALVVVASAIAESLPLNLDDNFVVPLVSVVTIALSATLWRAPALSIDPPVLIWIGLNAALAILGFVLRSVTLSGMITGFVLGSILILFAGWQLYVVLLLFFVIGSTATRAGYDRKASMGLAQERGGRRGFTHAFSNVGGAAILALLIPASTIDPLLLWIAAMAALATATADTVASELGQIWGRRPFLPLSFRRVPPGTEGAVSVEGTLAGAAAAVVVAVAAAMLLPVETGSRWQIGAIIATAAVVGSWIESVVGSWNRKQTEPIPNGALNFFNTMAGAAIAFFVASVMMGEG